MHIFVPLRPITHYIYLYTRYPIVARALGLAAVQPLGRVRARAKESCIQYIYRAELSPTHATVPKCSELNCQY